MKVVLQFPMPYASDLGDMLGLPLDRRQYLAGELDNLIKEAKTGPARMVYFSDILKRIQDICETAEEYTWLLCNHVEWLHRTGRAAISNKAR